MGARATVRASTHPTGMVLRSNRYARWNTGPLPTLPPGGRSGCVTLRTVGGRVTLPRTTRSLCALPGSGASLCAAAAAVGPGVSHPSPLSLGPMAQQGRPPVEYFRQDDGGGLRKGKGGAHGVGILG